MTLQSFSHVTAMGYYPKVRLILTLAPLASRSWLKSVYRARAALWNCRMVTRPKIIFPAY